MSELSDRGYFHELPPGYTIRAEHKDGDYRLVISVSNNRGAYMILTLRQEQMTWLGHDCLRVARE